MRAAMILAESAFAPFLEPAFTLDTTERYAHTINRGDGMMGSDQNVEVVRRWSESWSRQDVRELSACFSDEIEVDFSNAQGPFSGIYSGRDDVIRFCRSLWEAWDEITLAFEALIECGEECLVTANVLRAKGRTTGIDVEARTANLWTFRGGKVRRCKLYQTTDEALKAAGLSDQDPHADS